MSQPEPEGGAPLTSTAVYPALVAHATASKDVHLRALLADGERCSSMMAEHSGLVMDYSRQKITVETMTMLEDLVKQRGLMEKLAAMQAGAIMNPTEGRAVLHTALRAAPEESVVVDGVNVVKDVWGVLGRIQAFSDKVRGGEWKGATGKALVNTVMIGIGGSYLGPEFVCEALKFNDAAAVGASGRTIRFLANVDPADVTRALTGLDPAETLVCICSKTFTTAETMLNAKTVRAWVVDALGEAAVGKHVIAVSSAIPKAKAFGIDEANVFGFWDWVGGRYSVTSAIGAVPIALQFGFDIVKEFLAGARDIDKHVLTAPFAQNFPVLLGTLGVWNVSFLGIPVRAVLPYSQALARFPAHIQQVDMESNGKGVSADGTKLPYEAGEFIFGEPGTNGQHSFYQLLHQGRVANCEFIGYSNSPTPKHLEGEIANHDELMSNFFAQPDALALGKTADQCVAEGVPDELVAHKVFSGDRPSISLLMPEMTAFTTGQLLSMYEHRTVVQGLLWGNNPFDQWGVELGKVLAKQARSVISSSRSGEPSTPADLAAKGLNASTSLLMSKYLSASSRL